MLRNAVRACASLVAGFYTFDGLSRRQINKKIASGELEPGDARYAGCRGEDPYSLPTDAARWRERDAAVPKQQHRPAA